MYHTRWIWLTCTISNRYQKLKTKKNMTPYKSRSGKQSGVIAFEIGEDFIRVKFQSNKIYKYTYLTSTAKNVEVMKTLALDSLGLSTYISKFKPKPTQSHSNKW